MNKDFVFSVKKRKKIIYINNRKSIYLVMINIVLVII